MVTTRTILLGARRRRSSRASLIASLIGPLAAWGVVSAAASGCASADWGRSAESADARLAETPDDPEALVRAGEFALVVGGDLALARTRFEGALAQAPAHSPFGQRAVYGLAHLAELSPDVQSLAFAVAQALPALAAADAPADRGHKTPATAQDFAGFTTYLWGLVPLKSTPEQVGVDALAAALESVATRGGAPWEAARAEALRQLVIAARLMGRDSAQVAASRRRAGFIDSWRISAPWGQVPVLDFNRPLGPETRPLADAEVTDSGYDISPRMTTSSTFSDGEATLFDVPDGGGVGFAQAQLDVADDAAGDWVIRLESNRSAQVFVDGVAVSGLVLDRFAYDGPFLPAPWEAASGVRLSPGDHRVTVKFATEDGRGFFRVRALPAAAGGSGGGSGENTWPKDVGASSGQSQPVQVVVGDGAAAVRALARLPLLLRRPRRDVGRTYAAIKGLRSVLGDYLGLDFIYGRALRRDQQLPGGIRRQQARKTYERVLEGWPDNPATLRALARLERDDEREDRALSLYRRALAAAPDDRLTQLELLAYYRDRGWEAEALRLVAPFVQHDAAEIRAPHELSAVIDTLAAFGYHRRANALSHTLEGRFPGAAIARIARAAGAAGDQSSRAALLLQAFAAKPQQHGLLRGAVSALRSAGQLDRARSVVEEFLTARPQDGWALAELARIQLQMGDEDAARVSMANVLKVHPDFAPIERLVQWLDGQGHPFAPLQDGVALAQAFFAERAQTQEGQQGGDGDGDGEHGVITLLSRAEWDIRPDGSVVELTHKLQVVQTRAAADGLGDFRPPAGAELLRTRTIKADGRVLWPERTPGKPDLSFPELKPGDVIERAWITRARVRPVEGGYLGGFTFAGWDTPARQRLARVTVHGAGLKLRWTGRGGAPEATIEDVEVGEGEGRQRHKIVTWRAEDTPAIPREPLAVGARAFFPYVDLSVVRQADGAVDSPADGAQTGTAGEAARADAWRDIHRWYVGRVTALTANGPRVQELARSIAQRGAAEGEGGLVSQLWAAFSMVKEDMKETERFNSFHSAADTAIAAKKGNRAIVLTALGRALGAKSSLLLCAPRRDGRPGDYGSPTPNTNRFFYPVVRFMVDGGMHLADPTRPYAPFDVLPAELYGARCLNASEYTEDAKFRYTTLPPLRDYKGQALGWTMDVGIRIAANGDAAITIEGTGFGPEASGLRRTWINADEARRGLLWQQWAASIFPGATVSSFDVSDARDAEEPLKWTLTLGVSDWATIQGEGVRGANRLLPAVVASSLSGTPSVEALVSLDARETPLRISPHRERTRIVVSAPEGWQIQRGPEAVAFDLHGLSVRQTVDKSSGKWVIERSIDSVPGRVEPGDYGVFRAKLRDAIAGLAAGVTLGR